MKRSILKIVGMVILTVFLGFSAAQLSLAAVESNICPSDPFPPCACNLQHSVLVESGGSWVLYCTYGCYCPDPGGGGGHFYIERDYQEVIY
jgi:hypothetical protein